MTESKDFFAEALQLLHDRQTAFHEQLVLIQEQWNVETVHDVRVSCRRLRSALRTFSPYFDPGAHKAFDQRMKKFMKRFNSLRDLDVHLEILQELKPERQRPGEKEVRSAMSFFSRRKKCLDEKLKVFVKESLGLKDLPLPVLPETCAPEINQKLASILIPELEELARRLVAVCWSAPDGTFGALHALRIQVKRVRYGAEAFQNRLGPDAPQLLLRLKKLQDILGWVHDGDMLGDSVQRLLLDEVRERYHKSKALIRSSSWLTLHRVFLRRVKAEQRDTFVPGTLLLLKWIGKRRTRFFRQVRDMLEVLSRVNWTDGLISWFQTGVCPPKLKKLLASA